MPARTCTSGFTAWEGGKTVGAGVITNFVE